MFGDPTLPEKNFAKIQKLRQTGRVADFLEEAERLNMDSRLDQNVLRKLITTCIRIDIQESLPQIDQELDYSIWKTVATRIGLKKELFRNSQPKPNTNTNTNTKPHTQTRKDQPQHRPSNPTTTPSSFRTRNDVLVPQELVEQRKIRGECWKCGAKGYKSMECRKR